MALVVHPPGRGFSIAGHVHNSAGSVGTYSLWGAGSYVVASVLGGSLCLPWQTKQGKFSTDGNPVDTTEESYFIGARPTLRCLQQSPPSQYGLRRVIPRHRDLNGIRRFCHARQRCRRRRRGSLSSLIFAYIFRLDICFNNFGLDGTLYSVILYIDTLKNAEL